MGGGRRLSRTSKTTKVERTLTNAPAPPPVVTDAPLPSPPDDDPDRETAETEPMPQLTMRELVTQPPPPRRERRTKRSIKPLAKPDE